MKLIAKLELSYEYGHSGNRPDESERLKEIVVRLNEILDKEAGAKNTTGLSHWYLTAVKVE